MRCRSCGRENGRNTGRCDNCGFSLEFQTLPLKEQRSGLQKPLERSSSDKVQPGDLAATHKSQAGLVGLLVFLIGLAGAIYIVNNFERSEYEQVFDIGLAQSEEREVPLDSLPIMLGTDIVYVFDPAGTSAVPRTNVDLSLIPEGTGVSFLGSSSMSIQPVVNFMTQKLASQDFRALAPDSLYAWLDTTETTYSAVPILKPILTAERDTSAVQPVDVRILFTEQWMRCMVDEFNADYIEPSGGFRYNDRIFQRIIGQAERTITRRNTDERPVQVSLLFPADATLGQAIEIAESVLVTIDSLGYSGFNFRWVSVTD